MSETSSRAQLQNQRNTEIQLKRYLGKDILPILGGKLLKDITVDEVLAVQQKIETRGSLAVAEKVRTWLNEIFSYAIALGELQSNRAQCLEEMVIPYRRRHRNLGHSSTYS